MVSTTSAMVIDMKDSGWTVWRVERGFCSIHQAQNTKGIGRTTKFMDLGQWFAKIKTGTKEIFRMAWNLDTESIPTLMVLGTMENGLTMIRMVLELSNSQMQMFIKVNLLMEKEMVLVSTNMRTAISMMVILLLCMYFIW